jgi:hypothetical protein
MKGAITDLWYTSQYATKMSDEVVILVILEFASKTSNKIFGTNVESDFTARSSHEMQIWCRGGKNLTESQIERSWRTVSAL